MIHLEKEKSNKKRCVVVMFDTLCRRFLPTYNDDASWVIAPNFQRLAKRCVQFNKCYVGGMACMPARREMHTGRHSFLHRAWGPLEPFDDSMPALLQRERQYDENAKDGPVHTHIVTDHHHYWEDGGATYHQRYSTFEFVRGQEGDKWKGEVLSEDEKAGKNLEIYPHFLNLNPIQIRDQINRKYMPRTADMPQHRTFTLGLEFLEKNVDKDRFYLQIETFDPHEPFFTTSEWKHLYPHKYDGPEWDWPPYRPLLESDEMVNHMRCEFAALITLCDAMLGRVLDFFDRHNMWEDTMLIVNTDHGFLMGEKDWWAKVYNPLFDEIANIPFYVWDPRHYDDEKDANPFQVNNSIGKNLQCDCLVQSSSDIPATVMGYFGAKRPRCMTGTDLGDLLAHIYQQGKLLAESKQNIISNIPQSLHPHPHGGIFGYFGCQVNYITPDGKYVYMRGCAENINNGPQFEYTLMPTRMASFFNRKELSNWTESGGGGKNPETDIYKDIFAFTKGYKVMKVPTEVWLESSFLYNNFGSYKKGEREIPSSSTLLFDMENDPWQDHPLNDPGVELEMLKKLYFMLQIHDAPLFQYKRLGLPLPHPRGTVNGDPIDLSNCTFINTERGQRFVRQGGRGNAYYSKTMTGLWKIKIAKYGQKFMKEQLAKI